MSRIKFERAMRLIEGEFINPLSWWPEWFPPVNLAVLQSPLKDSDTKALQAAIESAVNVGELASTPRPYLLRPPVFDLSKDFAEQGIPCDQPTITAPDFAAWLAAQGETPSDHIKAWLAAVGAAQAVPAPAITIVATDDVKPASTSPVKAATTGARLATNKAALIAQHKHEWPTIERDIQDAAANGLSKAAKAGPRDWHESDALEWARSKNKLMPTEKPVSLDNVMRNLPAKRHVMGD